jgi:outer membrane biosynthesis protein TonB
VVVWNAEVVSSNPAVILNEKAVVVVRAARWYIFKPKKQHG